MKFISQSGFKKQWNIYQQYKGVFDLKTCRKRLWLAANETKLGHLRKNFKKILSNPKASAVFFKKKQSYSDIFQDNILKFASSAHWFIWYESLFTKCTPSIQKFLELQSEYERQMCVGNYRKAALNLTTVEENFGLSIWLITSRIQLFAAQGLVVEAQRYVDMVSKEDSLLGLISDRFFIKTQTENYDRFLDSLFNLFHEYRNGGNRPVADLVSFLLLPLARDLQRDSTQLMLYYSNLPIIDQYTLFKLTLAELFSRETIDNTQEARKVVKTLADNIHDEDLLRLWLRLSEKESCDENQIQILKLYSEGSYSDCIHAIESHMQTTPNDTACLEILAKCYVYTGKLYIQNTTDLQRIIRLLTKIIAVNDKCTAHIKELKSLLVSYYPQRWTIPLLSQLNNLFQHRTISEGIISAKIQYYFGSPATPKYRNIAITKKKYGFCEETEHEIVSTGDSVLITDLRKLKYSVIKQMMQDNKRISYDIIQQAILTTDLKLPYEIETLQSEIYLHNDELEKSLNIVIDNCIDNIESYRCFPLAELIKVTNSYEYDDVIYKPIALYIYNKKIGNEFSDELNDSYEDFMDTFPQYLPSITFGGKETLNKFEVYFLSNICIPTVMDTCPEFSSNTEVYSERIRILDLLLEQCDNHPNLLSSEQIRKERNTVLDSMVVEQGQLKYDLSKIYIDVESITKSKNDTLFSMYQNFLEEIKRTKSPGEIKKFKENQYYMSSDADVALYGLIEKYLQEFVRNPDYGLDKSLSTEVRHGVFSNLIRSRFEQHHLVTALNGEKYEDNAYWKEKYSMYIDTFIDELNILFANFSKSIDDIIASGNEWMKVTFEAGNKERLFNFNLSLATFNKYKYRMYNSESYQDVIDICKEIAWEKLDGSIETLLKKLHEDFKTQAEQAIGTFEDSIKEAKQQNSLTDLIDSIHLAKSGFLEDLKTVTDWFQVSKTLEIKDHTLDAIIKISIESFYTIKLNRMIQFSINDDQVARSLLLTGNDSKALITSLITAYDNAIKYGRHSEKTKIGIFITKPNQNRFTIKISNEYLHEDINKETFYSEIKRKIESEYHESLMYSEGGTGLYKITHLLTNSNPNFSVDVYENDESLFILDIQGVANENSVN